MHKMQCLFFPLSSLLDGNVCQTTGLSQVWCFTIHLLKCKLFLTGLCQQQRETIWCIWSKKMTWLKTKQLSVSLPSSMKPGHTAVVEEITRLTSPTEVIYSQMNSTWNWDQQTFLNPNAAPLCQHYASLLNVFAELLSIWCCDCESQRLLLAAQTSPQTQIRARIHRFVNHLILINLLVILFSHPSLQM